MLFLLPLLWSCPAAEPDKLPAGPADPVRNLAWHDAFVDTVQREGTIAAWIAATDPGADATPKSFGVLPLLLITDSEVAALNRRLNPQQQQCLSAIHDFAIRMQSESDPRVAPAMAGIAPLRQRIPDLGQLFTDEPNLAKRREQWLSQAEVARELAPRLRRVAAARKRWAWQRRRLDFVDLMKLHRGYDPAIAEKLENEVRRALAARTTPRRDPWEFELINPSISARMAARFDEANCLKRASSVLEHLGLPPSPAALQVREAKQTAFGSFAFYPIDPPVNQGITVRAGPGIVPHWSTFHEFGHAALSLLVTPSSCRTFRRPISPAVAESCAKIAERLFYADEWLRTQGVPSDEIAALRNWENESELMRMRSILSDVEFERVLYRDPTADLMTQYMAILRKTAGVEMANDFPAWALKRHIAFEPLARLDYLLARCGQAAVYRRLRQLPGGLLGEPARKVLREEVFRGAAGMRYEEWFRRATRTKPNCTAWLEDVAGDIR